MNEYTNEELRELFEQAFEQEKETAFNCPQRKREPNMVCDDCNLVFACSSIVEEY